jgi:hypothetical protein
LTGGARIGQKVQGGDRVRSFIVFMALLAAAAFGAVTVASEYGGEVVVLTTTDAEGVDHRTSLWIVEDEGRQWLRAGNSESGWYQRLRGNPEVRLERAGQLGTYRAFPDPTRTQRINFLMARDYGVADRLIGLLRDDARSMAVRLEPVDPTPF